MNPENYFGETIVSLDGLIHTMRGQMEAEPPKPAVSDYLRLLQLRLELGKDRDILDRRPISARWVDDESLPEPDPDPNVPWPGDESLT